jgi:hypothetical protein
MLIPRSIATASVSLLTRQPCWTLLNSFVPGVLAFSAQSSLTQPCTCQSFFSVYLVTGLPQCLKLESLEGDRIR